MIKFKNNDFELKVESYSKNEALEILDFLVSVGKGDKPINTYKATKNKWYEEQAIPVEDEEKLYINDYLPDRFVGGRTKERLPNNFKEIFNNFYCPCCGQGIGIRVKDDLIFKSSLTDKLVVLDANEVEELDICKDLIGSLKDMDIIFQDKDYKELIDLYASDEEDKEVVCLACNHHDSLSKFQFESKILELHSPCCICKGEVDNIVKEEELTSRTVCRSCLDRMENPNIEHSNENKTTDINYELNSSSRAFVQEASSLIDLNEIVELSLDRVCEKLIDLRVFEDINSIKMFLAVKSLELIEREEEVYPITYHSNYDDEVEIDDYANGKEYNLTDELVKEINQGL